MEPTTRKKKSVPLEKHELKAFRAYVDSFHTITDAVEDLGLNTINQVTRVLAFGSAAPQTVEKIRLKISV